MNRKMKIHLDDEILKKIAHKRTENLRAKLRLMVKRILRKYKYPPHLQDSAVELVLQQMQVLGKDWSG